MLRDSDFMLSRINFVSMASIPVFVLGIIIYGYLNNVELYEAFKEGAGETFILIKNIFPALLAMLMAINLFFASGVLTLVLDKIDVVLAFFNIPEEILPLLILRPLSGSAALAYVTKLLKKHGPDSLLGKMASTVQGSTETTFYIITVYFGAIQIKEYRYAIIIGLLADLAGFLSAVFFCNIFFN